MSLFANIFGASHLDVYVLTCHCGASVNTTSEKIASEFVAEHKCGCKGKKDARALESPK